jgi:hypothetical protein
MTSPEPGPATETWTYAGVRVGKGGRRVHAWLDADGEELLFTRTGARMAVGSHYTVSVTRHQTTITLHGTPAYAGMTADAATRRACWAEHTVAQTRLEMIRAERSAARRSALDEALAPLLELAGPLRTGAERDALAAYVLRKIHSASNPK